MGSVAVRDLVERTDHEVAIGELRTAAADELATSLGIPVHAVDVEDAASLASALADTDLVLNTTLMRLNPPVTRAAIQAGVHLVDLGAYWRETVEQLEMDDEARAAGCRIVPGCGVAPGLTNILVRHAADRLEAVESVRLLSYITHPMSTSPGIVYTRFDASVGTAMVLHDGRLEERPCFGDHEAVAFPEPYGTQSVHLVPHPEPVTLPRYLDLRDVVFKVGYPPDETARIRALLELGFDSGEPFEHAGARIVPRDLAAAYIGRAGVPGDLPTANLKRVEVGGRSGGRLVTLVSDLVVERVGEPSASAAITGTVAAVAANLVAEGGPAGVLAPEAVFEPGPFLEALRERGFEVSEATLTR